MASSNACRHKTRLSQPRRKRCRYLACSYLLTQATHIYNSFASHHGRLHRLRFERRVPVKARIRLHITHRFGRLCGVVTRARLGLRGPTMNVHVEHTYVGINVHRKSPLIWKLVDPCIVCVECIECPSPSWPGRRPRWGR